MQSGVLRKSSRQIHLHGESKLYPHRKRMHGLEIWSGPVQHCFSCRRVRYAASTPLFNAEIPGRHRRET